MSEAVVFRCNVSAQVGVGHLMRCREMAKYLQGLGIASALIGPPESMANVADKTLFTHWIPVEERGSSEQDAARVLDMCARLGTRHAVMDDYRIDPAYQALLRGAGVRWLQQFDASAPWMFECDVLVNASPYETRAQYLKWLQDPARTQTLFGPSYAVVRPEFATLTAGTDGRTVKRIFVGFGGGDDRGALSVTLEALAGRFGADVTLVLVSGPNNPRNESIAEQVNARPKGQAELHIGPPDMPALMAGCDLAVIGGGTMSYEAAICGLPTIFMALAPNQDRPCMGWNRLTGALYLGQVGAVTSTTLHHAVLGLIEDGDTRTDMAARGRALVDGKGGARLAGALLERDLL
jgi:UDP-2,4-diacetamido-2,4,6-trideoxy-beta-L-altropyranose hydrolase